jgi:hypothetical protein
MATKANIIIDQGSDFSNEILLTDDDGIPLDLSSYTVTSQIRKWYGSSNSVNFNANVINGAVVLTLNADSTSSLSAGRYLYDVLLINPSNTITRVVEGIVTVNPSVTRTANVQTYYSVLVGNVHGSFYSGDTVYQSNGSANISGLVYNTETLSIDISNTMMVYISNATGAFVPTMDSSYRFYSTNTVSNTSSNGSVITVTTSIYQ